MTASAVVRQRTPQGQALRRLVSRHPVATFLLLVFSVNVAVAQVPVLTRRDILPFNLALYDSLGPICGVALPAFLVVAATSGMKGVRDLASRCLRWRVRLRWYAFAFLSVPAGVLLSAYAVFGRSLLVVLADRWTALFTAVLPQLALLILCFIVAEEVGFTGFLQARWQNRFGPLQATLLVEIPFAVYHLPNLMVESGLGLAKLHIALAFLGVLAVLQLFGRVVITWLYNVTGSSVLLAGLWHSTFDATTSAFSRTFAIPGAASNAEVAGFWIPSAVVAAFAVVVVVVTRGRLGYDFFSGRQAKEPRVIQPPAGGTALRSPVKRRQIPSLATGIMAALTLLIILAAAAAGVAAGGTLHGAVPKPVPASAPATEFSSARALEHVRIVANQPHPMGSPANAAVRDYLVSELRGLGLTPQVQRATAAFYPVPGILQAGTPENVLARLPGTDPNGKAFMLTAHYDSVPAGPGATDNGSSVGTALETLRALKAGPPPRNDVIVLFTDGEERGLLGARAFVDQHPWAGDVGVVLNLDNRGTTGPAVMLETNEEGGWVVDQFAKATPYPMTTSDSVAFFKRSGGDSDLSVFLHAGWAGLQVTSTGGISHYHSRLDNIAELDERSLQHLGSYALALTRHFGSVSLEQAKAPDVVYFNVFRFLVQYPETWSIPLAGFAVLLWAGVVTLGLYRRRLRPGGLGLGFVIPPVAVAAAALVSQLTWMVIIALHPGGVWALEYRPTIIWIGIASLSVAVTATLYAALRNRIGALDLAVGGLLWWLLLAVATSVVFPPASYLFTWPLLFSLLGLGILLAGEGRPTAGWRGFTVLVITGIPAVFMAASAAYGITMTRELLLPYVAPIFAAAMVVMLGLLIPHLDLIARAGRWVLAAGSAVLAIALLLAGSVSAGFDARHPQPDNIMYALNADTGQAVWISPDAKPDAWTAQFLGAQPQRSSVAEHLGDAAPKLHAPAPSIPLAAPSVRFADVRDHAGTRMVTMHVTASARANLIVLDTDVEVVGATIDGRPVASHPLYDASPASPWTLNFWNPPAQGFDLTLEVKGTGSVRVTARASTPGLPLIPGTVYQKRPPDTMPISASPTSIEQDSSTVVSKSFILPAP